MPIEGGQISAAPLAAAGETLVEAKDLFVELGGREILRNVSLSVRRGEVVTLIGPNGAGKSTLVRILLGLMKPTRGSVIRRPAIRVGYMPQIMTIDRDMPMTVWRFLKLSGVSARDRLAQVLDEVGAAYTADQAVQELSGGEFQRILLARALLRRPDLLVLDEPVRSVDVTGQAELYDLIGQLRYRYGCGVLMVSHDLHLVMAATDVVICLNQHVCCAGSPESVSRHPEYFALFGPSIAQSLAVYTHAHDHSHDTAGHIAPLPGSTAEPHMHDGGEDHGHHHDEHDGHQHGADQRKGGHSHG
jgi:zinc transport system ATP-binding protein